MAQLDEEKIHHILRKTKKPTKKVVSIILDKAKEKKGLELEEVGFLINLNDPELEKELFRIASKIKQEIYGERLVFLIQISLLDEVEHKLINELKETDINNITPIQALSKLHELKSKIKERGSRDV